MLYINIINKYLSTELNLYNSAIVIEMYFDVSFSLLLMFTTPCITYSDAEDNSDERNRKNIYNNAI